MIHPNDIAARSPLIFDFTMADIDKMANGAAASTQRRMSWAINPMEAREEAWQGIVTFLYSWEDEDNPPTGWEVYNAGSQAVAKAVRTTFRHHGRREDGLTGPRFQAYWTHVAGPKADWTDAVIDRMALPGILEQLSPIRFQAIVTLAAFMDPEYDQPEDGEQQGSAMARAAEALGVSYKTFHARVTLARKQILQLWFDQETPRSTSLTRVDDDGQVVEQCRSGHLRSKFGQFTGLQWRCMECDRKAGRNRARASRVTKVDSLEGAAV